MYNLSACWSKQEPVIFLQHLKEIVWSFLLGIVNHSTSRAFLQFQDDPSEVLGFFPKLIKNPKGFQLFNDTLVSVRKFSMIDNDLIGVIAEEMMYVIWSAMYGTNPVQLVLTRQSRRPI